MGADLRLVISNAIVARVASRQGGKSAMAQRVVSRPEDDESAANRQTASLAALAATLLLVVLALQLIRVLSASAAIEDCLMAGRRDCDAVVRHLQASPPAEP
jgi:hypothetical protein